MQRYTPWLFAMAGALAGGALALAQMPPDAENVPQTQPADREWFTLNPRNLYLELDTEYESRRVRSSRRGQPDGLHENRDFRLDERMGFGFDGYLYDPNLLEYMADLEFGLSQTHYTEEIEGYRDTESDSGCLQEYDVSLDILKNKPFSIHAYARRYEQRVPRRFLPSLREIESQAGISALATYGSQTTEFGFEWRDVERSGNRRDEDEEELEVGRLYLDHLWKISDDQQLRLQYDHDREESTYQGTRYDYNTRHDEIRLEHDLAFGDAGQHQLNTLFRYNDEQGDLARDELEFVPRLTLEHSDRFKTIYRYGAYRYEQDALEVNQHQFDVQALYRPTDELRLSVDGYGLYERVDLDVETYEFGGGTDMTYQRSTDHGELSINVALAYDYSRTRGDAGRRLVRDEAHQLGGSRPVSLQENNILAQTIVAHNAARTRFYVPGVDYLIAPIGRRIYVERTLTGRIEHDEVVYFDYSYVVPADATINAYRTDFLVEHAFSSGLTPYYGFESRCETTNSSMGTPRYRDDTHRHRIGLRCAKSRYEVGSEYEIFDDTVEPYDAWHLTGRVALLRAAEHSLDASAELSRYWFEGGVDERRVWWLDADVKDRLRINSELSLLSGIDYHWEDDSVDGRTNGLDLECGIEFVRGYLSMDLTLEYDLLSVLGNREQGVGVYLNVRRDLSHLLKSRQGGDG